MAIFIFLITAKPVPDEIMVYHLIHSSKNRGQVGQFTLEEFWNADSRIRINNTNNGASLYTTSPLMSKTDILQNAFIVSYFRFTRSQLI